MDISELLKHMKPMSIPRPNHLEPGGELLFTSPVVFEYYQKLGELLLDTSNLTTLGVLFVLCMPSFRPEWAVRLERVGRTLTLTYPAAPIWPVGSPLPKIENAVAGLELKSYEAIESAWLKMIRLAHPFHSGWSGLDGETYVFGYKQHGLMTAETWSPDPNTAPGRLVRLGESLREYALADPVLRPEMEERIQEEAQWFETVT